MSTEDVPHTDTATTTAVMPAAARLSPGRAGEVWSADTVAG
jgi:hypothetical protein